jgi:pimeloyl-ACP methyl ester carboxylesterase
VDACNEPSRWIAAPDGTPVAVFTSGSGPALVLVHGTTGDHTTFRVVRPLLEPRFTLHAIDRRGRGASGDRDAYAIEREFEDVAAVADWAAAEVGGPVVVVGHSYGGRVALGAACTTDSIRAVVCYEGAPAPTGSTYHPDRTEDRLRERLGAGDREGAHTLFMREVVGMSEADLERYRADPVWPARVAAAHTILRELEAETAPAASLESLGAVRQPVLQVLGGASLAVFREATRALDARLVDSRVVVIDGARHAAHHTHPEAFVAVIETFVSSLPGS